MHNPMTRRHWLERTLLAAAGVAISRETVLGADRVAGRYIKLDQNENPYGISSKTEEAILGMVQRSNRYPGRQLADLRDLIAGREGVPGECVLLGAGCTEIFSLACLLYGSDGKEVLVAEPTYSGFIGYVERLRGRLTRVPVNERWKMDLAEMARRVTNSTSLVYVCNPNNPTGTIVEPEPLRAFCKQAARQGIVFVDEAYFELVDDSHRASMIALVREGANVIVGRTFSKIYGLAGLRVGYGIASPPIVREMRRIQTNFAPVNQLGLAAAGAAYLDTDYIAACRTKNARVKDDFYAVLNEIGHKPIAGSQTNFVCFEAKGGAQRLVTALRRDHNIGVRTYHFLSKDRVRVSLGTREEMEVLAEALRRIG